MERRALDLTRLRAALEARWARIEVVDETESTNADLLADPAAPDRAVRVAEHQRAGRGRFDRQWSSPPRAGLTFSVLLRPAVPIQHWGWLPLLAGVALHDAVFAASEIPTALKWPNDLLAAGDERKLAGILAQTSGDAVVVGIGLNVDTTAEELPVPSATSLALAGANGLDRMRTGGRLPGRLRDPRPPGARDTRRRLDGVGNRHRHRRQRSAGGGGRGRRAAGHRRWRRGARATCLTRGRRTDSLPSAHSRR